MKIDGRCHCGAVGYTAEIDPDNVSVCHCTDCQALTGSPYRVTVLARASDVTLSGAAPALYVKTADNGRKRLQYFCGTCGTPIFATGEGPDASEWGLRWGNIRQRRDLVPRRQIWCRSALPWVAQVAELPGIPGD